MSQKIECQFLDGKASEQQQQLENLFSFYEESKNALQSSTFNQVYQRRSDQNIVQTVQQQKVKKTKINFYNCNQIYQIPEQQNQEEHLNQQTLYNQQAFCNMQIDHNQIYQDTYYDWQGVYCTQKAQSMLSFQQENVNADQYQQQCSINSTYSYNMVRKKKQYNSQEASSSINKSLDFLINSQKNQASSNKPIKNKKKKPIKEQNSSSIFCNPNKNICYQQNKGILLFDPSTLLKKVQNKFTSFKDSKNQQSFKGHQKQLNDMLANLGIKSSNKLGKSKTQRQIKNICSYLRNGILPKDYLDQFNQLIQN